MRFFLSIIILISLDVTAKSKVYLYPNAKLTSYLNSIVTKLNKGKDKYQVKIINDEKINAFITEKDEIFIHRGIISLFNSEAQIAAVLAHELAHIKDKHILKLHNTKQNSAFLSNLAIFTTRNYSVGQAINMLTNVKEHSFGRKLELQADKLATKYLYQAKYDPKVLITVLKALNTIDKFYFKAKPNKKLQYHGLFSSHPRTYLRLQKSITQMDKIPPGEDFIGKRQFREATTNLVFGTDYRAKAKEHLGASYSIWIDKQHRVKLIYPQTMQQYGAGASITFSNTTSGQAVTINAKKTKDSNCYQQKLAALDDPKTIKTLDSHTYSYIETSDNQVTACVVIGKRQYKLVGFNHKLQVLTKNAIAQLQAIIASFKRAVRQDFLINSTKYISYYQAQPGDNFKKLSSISNLGKYSEEYLRIINQYYQGDPEPGEYIKLVK